MNKEAHNEQAGESGSGVYTLHAARYTLPLKLNLGCGGRLREGFVNVDKFYSAAEITSGRVCRDRWEFGTAWRDGMRYVQGDLLDLPFPDGCAELVWCGDALEHVSFWDVPKALGEMRRVLAEGGRLGLSVPDFNDIAFQWLTQITPMPLDVNYYWYIMEQVYGHQRAEGEYHRVAFTAEFLNWNFCQAGWDPAKIKITHIPRGVVLVDPETGAESVARTAHLEAEAIK